MVKWKGKIDKGVLIASSTLTDGVLPITIVIKVFLKVLKNYTIWLSASLYRMTSHLTDIISIERVWQSGLPILLSLFQLLCKLLL